MSVVARRYDVNANQVFSWRRQFDEAPRVVAPPHLVPVMVVPDQPVAAVPSAPTDPIEIELPGGYRVRVGSKGTAAALRLVLDAVKRR